MTAAKVELGRHLFYDRRLSGTGDYACASCHRQERAFTDGRARAVGATGEVHPRSAMSLANVAYNATLTWADPQLHRLEEQMLVPMLNEQPVELGLAGRTAEAFDRFRADPRYRRLFDEAFPGQEDPIRLDNVIRAIACFERTLLSGDSPYDRLIYRDEREAFSTSAWRGMRLFFSPRLACSECHGGFNFSGPVDYEGAGPPRPTFHNTGLYDLGAGAYPASDPGLIRVTGEAMDMGRFRAPTLRNIALTAPYMHDGSIATLRAVVEHYMAGGRTVHAARYAGTGRENPYKSDRITGFALTERDKVDLVSFLENLTDRSFVTDRRFSDPFYSSRSASE
jgi:cytochrome c peroxidase